MKTISQSSTITPSVLLPAHLPWIMLFSRLFLFAGIQALFAIGFLLAGSSNAWEESANWWPFIVAIANVICLSLLIRVFQTEGKDYWDIFRIEREHISGDILFLVGVFVIGGPLAYFPNVLLGGWLFGDPEKTLELFVRPLPLWTAYISILLFPITQGLVEIATYFGYVKPRFESQGMPLWLTITLPALLLGLQHLAMPLLFDIRFILWRGLMYIPVAFFVGIVMHWRARLLPYFAIVHTLMNMSFATMFLGVAY